MKMKKIVGTAAGITLAAAFVLATPLASQAASGWSGGYIDGAHCQADRRLFIQEGYNVGPCGNRAGYPGQWFQYWN